MNLWIGTRDERKAIHSRFGFGIEEGEYDGEGEGGGDCSGHAGWRYGVCGAGANAIFAHHKPIAIGSRSGEAADAQVLSIQDLITGVTAREQGLGKGRFVFELTTFTDGKEMFQASNDWVRDGDKWAGTYTLHKWGAITTESMGHLAWNGKVGKTYAERKDVPVEARYSGAITSACSNCFTVQYAKTFINNQPMDSSLSMGELLQRGQFEPMGQGLLENIPAMAFGSLRFLGRMGPIYMRYGFHLSMVLRRSRSLRWTNLTSDLV